MFEGPEDLSPFILRSGPKAGHDTPQVMHLGYSDCYLPRAVGKQFLPDFIALAHGSPPFSYTPPSKEPSSYREGYRSSFADSIKQEKGISFGKLAKATGTSYAYWHNQIFQAKNPPTYQKARQIAEVLEIDVESFVNMVLRDRLIHFLEKERLLSESPGTEIRRIVRGLQEWKPEGD